MKINNNNIGRKGVTLIELTVVIAIILLLISILFIGVSYYRQNANTAACVTNLSNMQKAMRTVQNIENLNAGDTVAFIGAGLPMENEPECPGGGTYTVGDTVTAIGAAIATCDHADGHAPDAATLASW